MSHDEVQGLKEDIFELKKDVREIHVGIADLRVLIAGNYVTKKDLEKHIEDEKNTRWKWASGIIGASGVVMAILKYIRG